MITAVSPQLDEIGVVPLDQLDEFLARRRLVARPLPGPPNTIVVFDEHLAQEVDRVDPSAEYVIRRFSSIDQLVDDMSQSLARRGEAVFAPAMKTLRHFFNTAGFVSRMKAVESMLPQAVVIVPAGVYGTRHLFGLRAKQAT